MKNAKEEANKNTTNANDATNLRSERSASPQQTGAGGGRKSTKPNTDSSSSTTTKTGFTEKAWHGTSRVAIDVPEVGKKPVTFLFSVVKPAEDIDLI